MSLETTLLYTLLRGKVFSASKYVGSWLSRQRASSTGLITDETRGLGTDRALQDGKAVAFNGLNEGGEAVWNFQNQTKLSGACWVKSSLAVSGNYTLFGTDDLTLRGWALRTRNGENGELEILACEGGIANNYVRFHDATTTDLHDGQWHHVGFTLDHSATPIGRLYIDGAEVSTTSTGAGSATKMDSPSSRPTVAFRDGSTKIYSPFTLFDIQFEGGVVWTAQQFANAYNGINRTLHSGTASARHYKLDELNGFDSSGNESNLTLSNTPTLHTGPDVPFSWQNSVGYTEGKNMITYGNLGDADVGIGFSPYGLDGMQIQGTQGGVSASIVGTGEIDGVSYLDYRVVGTNSSGSTYFFNIITNASADPSLEIPAAEGDVHTISAYIQLIAGSLTGTSRILYVHQRTAGGVLLVGGAGTVDPDGTLTRYSSSPTCPATTAKIVNRGMYIGVAAGNTVDITLRVGNLQVERGPLTDYQATKGVYSYGKLLPRDESNQSQDVYQNALTETGIAPSPGQLVQSNCLTLNGTDQYVQLGVLSGNLHSFRCRFYTDVEINSATTNKALFWYDTASDANAIVLGGWTGLSTNEVITIGSATGNGRTTVNDITIAIGWHELEVVWNGTTYDIILDDVVQTTTAGSSGHTGLETLANAALGYRGSGFYPGSLCDIEIKTDASTVLRNIPCSEGAGQYVTDTVSRTQYAIQEPGSNWGVTQDVFHQNYEKGFSVPRLQLGANQVVGSELAVPGTYDNTITSFTDDSFETTAGATNARVFLNLNPADIGKDLFISFRMTFISGGGNISVYGRQGLNGAGTIQETFTTTLSVANGYQEFCFNQTTANFSILFAGNSAGVSYTIDSFEIRESVVDSVASLDAKIPAAATTPGGTELVTNGTFDTDLTGWTVVGGGWTWADGKALLTGDGSAQRIEQYGIFEIGRWYFIRFDVTSSSVAIGFQNAAGNLVGSGSSGTVTSYWQADRTSLSFKRLSGSVTGTIDNITVQEMVPVTTSTVDCNDLPLTNPPKIGLNGCETRAEFCSNPNAPEFFNKNVPGDGVLAAYQFDGDPGDVVVGRDTATEEGKFSLRKS